MAGNVLIIDDDASLQRRLQRRLLECGWTVLNARQERQALSILEREPVDVVLLTDALGGNGTLDLLGRIHNEYRAAMVIVMCRTEDLQHAVEVMKQGASDLMFKPFDFAKIEVAVNRAVDMLGMRRQISALRRRDGSRTVELIGESPTMRAVMAMVEKVAGVETTVLITGQSGTGKELIARAIHQHSDRIERPFVAVSCTALQETLLESELFGHEKGAFTDAGETKEGLFEVASQGTLFLDEVGDMDLKIQGKLLRALEDQSIRRVGGTRNIKVNVRVIAATNRDLSAMVQAGEFREDLYYRLRVVPIHLPPLVQRENDVLLLSEHFIAEFNVRFGKNIRGLTPVAAEGLKSYNWPGNIRELRNLLERVILLEDCALIGLENLPAEIVGRRISPSSDTFQAAKSQVVTAFERRYVERLLREHGGNVSRAARSAGLERGSFQRLMRKHAVRSDAYRPLPAAAGGSSEG